VAWCHWLLPQAALPGARVATLSGGDKRNAIAREARAMLLLAPGAPAAHDLL
jgi:hypothetical protein